MSMYNDGKVVVEVMRALAEASESGYEASDTLDLLVQAATSFTRVVEAGILIADCDQHLHVVASSKERSADVEEAQLGFEQGPCLVAFRTGETLDVPNIAASWRAWPTFAAIAEARGFQAAHVVPLRPRGHNAGVLCLFLEELGPMNDRDAASIEVLVRAATTNLDEELPQALDARVTIELAKGVLAQQYGVPMGVAFSLLRAHARKTDTRLSDIAGKIVDSRGKFR
ncbi:GAF and ANTAR domain-containing protein [Cryobacterium cryoconiti]|uniref:ANTAR domain-containing protein n=1 Tax=Cryobacterium cryoconiti TaxID=1259239 RepID=A0A4Y8JZV9_9MICO|nr:GAF and ANTAR domain-containing protein [Cryobacterium cryoconiti]TFD34129.1 ANTAR domain-containing protein [Cryobacterium cryoconiti]